MVSGLRRALHVAILMLTLLAVLAPLASPVAAQDAETTTDAAAVVTEEAVPTEVPTEVSVAPTEPPETPAATEEPTQPPSPTATATATATKPATATREATKPSTPKATATATTAATTTATKTVSAATSPMISLSKKSGPVGTSVTVTISDFPGSTSLTVSWDTKKLGTVKTNRSGDASYAFSVPAAVAGSHKVVVAMSGRSRSAAFTVTPRIKLSPTSGAAGVDVMVTLTGFGAAESVAIKWGTATAKTVKTDATGSWSGNVDVPAGVSAGSVTVTADGAKNDSTAAFTVGGGPASPTAPPTATPGTLIVKLVDDDGDPLPGACFTAYLSVSGAHGANVGEACDAADGKDGTTTFGAVSSGALLISEKTAPDGYLPAGDSAVTVSANRSKTITVENGRNSGFSVVKTDERGAPLGGACFSVYTSLQNGNLGTLKASACDDDDDANDGVVRFGDLETNTYALVEKVVPRGYARAPKQTFAFTAGGNKAIVVQDAPGGAAIVNVINEAGDPVVGACFDAYVDLGGGALGNFVDRACNDDGSTVTIDGLPVGTYFLVQSHASAGYLAAANARFTIVAKKDSALVITDLPTTKVVVRKMDENSLRLPGACFAIYKAATDGRGKQVYDATCDNKDGKDDGYLTLPLSPGSYLLAETKAPKGFLTGEDIRFRITTGLDTDLDVVDQLGGIAAVTDIDQLEPWYIPVNACFTVWDKQNGTRTKLGTACDGDDKVKDGITHVVGLPTGTWYLEQTRIPWGYFDSPGFSIDMTAGETTDIDFYNEHWPLLLIHKVDENGDPLGGACFTAFVDNGGGQRGTEWKSPSGPLCDTDEDGELAAWVTPGNQILVETKSPLEYLPIVDTPFVMVRGEVTELTVEDFHVGLISVTKTDLEGKTLTGACFEAYHEVNGKRGALAASGCDRETTKDTYNKTLDGVTILNGLEPGDYLVAEKTAPKGYFPADDTDVTVDSAQNDVVVADEAWPTITITKVDDTGAAVNGACFTLYTIKNGARGPAFGTKACSNLSNTIVIGAPTGSYILAETTTPKGSLPAKDLTVIYKRGVDKTMTVVDPPAGQIKITDLDEVQHPLAGACWELWTDQSGKPGKKVIKDCGGTSGATFGVTEMETTPGKYWLRQTKTPEGYQPLPDRKVTLVARQPLVLSISDQPFPRWVVNSVDAANRPLPGACFDLYLDGGATLGKKIDTKLCDKDGSADGKTDDGTVTRRLEPGRYVAREVVNPPDYVKADDIKFTIAPDTDLVLKLTHKLGGTLTVTTQNRASLKLTGACYEVWTKLANGKKGVLVAKACDKDASDSHSVLDGTTKLTALPPGNYILAESFSPAGYAKADDMTAVVVAGQEVPVTVINDES